jgi:hypothetical protein
MEYKILNKVWGIKTVLVDPQDFDIISQYTWGIIYRRGIFQAMRRVNRWDVIFMHRFILGLKFGDGKIVEHINGNGLDNRRSNLRVKSAHEK